jgi:hypothetical protein
MIMDDNVTVLSMNVRGLFSNSKKRADVFDWATISVNFRIMNYKIKTFFKHNTNTCTFTVMVTENTFISPFILPIFFYIIPLCVFRKRTVIII